MKTAAANNLDTGATQFKVSVVICCRNEIDDIEACLQSVLQQSQPPGGVEIIIADGISTDGTREYLVKMAEKHAQLRVLDNRGRIVSTGLNSAIRSACGEIIVRMDAHTIYASDYIIQGLGALQETGADNVGGPMRTVAHTYMERAIRAVFHSAFAVGGARSHNESYEGRVDTVIYGCWKKEIFTRIGYFDEQLVRNQDDEFNLRLTRAGGSIFQSPSIRSWYHVRGKLSSVFRQYMQYGYWKVQVIRRHTRPASFRHLVPGAFLGALLGLLLVGLFWTPACLTALALIFFYVVCVIVASVVAASGSDWKLLPVLPATFFCFHLGYGYGFLRGVLDLVLSRKNPTEKFTRLSRAENVKTPIPK